MSDLTAAAALHGPMIRTRFKIWVRDWLATVPRVILSLPVAALVMVPDSEVHAKLFRIGMILDNLGHRGLVSPFS